MRKQLVVAALAAVAACGPKPQAQLTPTLPGEGSAHVTPATDTAATPETPADPWTGRADLIKAPPAKAPQPLELPAIDRFTLPNGLQVIVVRDARLPEVSMQLAIKAGRGDEPRAHLGVAEFTADMLVRGTKKRKALDIAKAVDFAGGGLSVDASFEATVASCKVLAKDLPMCLDLLPDVIMNPSFPVDEMPHVREQLLAEVHQRLDDAATLASLHVQNLLWGDSHVRGWVTDEAAVAAITQQDLQQWHDTWYAPGNSVLAIAGDLDPKKVEADLKKAFGGWKALKTPPHPKYGEPRLSGVRIRLVDMPKQTQTHIRVAQLGLRHDDPRFFDSLVWNYVLGGGDFSSRLMEVVRAKGGKTYGASSVFDRNLERGSFVVQTYTRNAEAVATTKLLLAEIAKMAKDGPTDQEVADAVANIAGSYAVRFQSAADVTGALLGAELHGFGDEYIRNFAVRIGKVDAASAKQAAHDVLDPTNFVIVMVGNAAEVEPQLEKEGWKFEKVKYTDSIGAPYEQPAGPPPPLDPKAEAAGKKLIEAALKAKGGEAKLRALKTIDLTVKGVTQLPGPDNQPTPADIMLQRRVVLPDALRVDIKLSTPKGELPISYAVRGGKGWAVQPQDGQLMVGDLPDDQIKELARQQWTDPDLVLLRAKDKGAKVHALPDQKGLDGVEDHLVNITSADDTLTVTLFLDKKTNLVRQLAYPDQGGVSFDVFDDYKDVDGLQVAHKRQSKNEVEALDLEVTAVKLNGDIDPKVFDKPAASAP